MHSITQIQTLKPPFSPSFLSYLSRKLHYFSNTSILFLSLSLSQALDSSSVKFEIPLTAVQQSTMAVLLCLVVFLAFSGYSNAAYCVCKDGVGEQVLQKAIDYACGNGADCTQIQPNGACYNPNTVKFHCDYAVNSYFQKKGGAQGSCDFQGTATISSSAPSASGSCSFTSGGGGTGTGSGTGTTTPSPSTGGTGTGMGTPPTGTTPSTTPTPSTGTGTSTPTTTPSTGGGGTGTGTSTPVTTPTTGSSTGTTTGNPSVFGPGTMGLGPTGSSGTGMDSTGTDGAATLSTNLVVTLAMGFLVAHLI